MLKNRGIQEKKKDQLVQWFSNHKKSYTLLQVMDIEQDPKSNSSGLPFPVLKEHPSQLYSHKTAFCIRFYLKNMCCAQSHLTLCYPHGLQPARLLCPWDFPGKNTGVGCHFLLQGIFPIQGSNPCLQARILEWVAISSSRVSSQSRDQTCVSYIGRQILDHCPSWEALI